MEPPLESPELAPARPKRGWRLRFWILAFGIFLLGIALVCVLMVSSSKKLIWLNSVDLSAADHPGLFARLKSQIKQVTMPLWKRFQHGPRIVQLDGEFLSMSRATTIGFDFGPPISTNSDGMRAWILSPGQLDAFRQIVRNNAGISSMNPGRIQTLDARQAQMQLVHPLSGIIPSNSTTGVITSTLVNVLPKVGAYSVNVTVWATVTAFPGWSPAQQRLTRTNFAVACQVVIPDSGALVVDGGSTGNTGSTNYWFVISPLILDEYGRRPKR